MYKLLFCAALKIKLTTGSSVKNSMTGAGSDSGVCVQAPLVLLSVTLPDVQMK
jgi:hypothetical protein